MKPLELAHLPWTAVRDLRASGRALVALLPIGAFEAHGPHLPLETDAIIARTLAERVSGLLQDSTVVAGVLPTLPYAPAEYASAYAGTLSIRPETLRALIVDIARALATQGFRGLVLVNGHLEPDHVRNLRAAATEARSSGLGFVLAPEWTSARYRPLLPEEFFTGGAHAGGHETALVLAARPELVDEAARRDLKAKPTDLAAAMKAGAKSFTEVPGGELGYFGDPAGATAAGGNAVYDRLAAEVAREVREALAR